MDRTNATMQQAMRLMRSGDLRAATRALQQGLTRTPSTHAGAGDAALAPGARGAHVPGQGARTEHARTEGMAWPGTQSGQDHCIDGEFRVVESNPSDPPSREQRGDASEGTFAQAHFECSSGALDYKLYAPALVPGTRAPLLLMLHGCTQSADDFARGTRMNLLAGERGYVVAYPQQSAKRNPNRCWNWFRDSDQQRGQGEPATLAALTRHLIAQHGLDQRRVYVAGLSAGGAMAAVLASTHPDVYAAIGVHSGLPIGLAGDVPSALAAMRTGEASARDRVTRTARRPVPTIVFHGDGDTTVHPRNGTGVIAQGLAAGSDAEAAGIKTTIERGVAAAGRHYTRTRHARDGRVVAEHWLTHGGAHAWSGGDPAGSYTDPDGPDASAQMLRFFAAYAQPA